jgi:hypothetical protein
MAEQDDYVIGRKEMNRIREAFKRAEAAARSSSARRERRVEDILPGDIPTFMELRARMRPFWDLAMRASR